MIYLDSSVVLARLLFETRAPSAPFWEQRLVSSRLLEYEVWTRVSAYNLSDANKAAAASLLAGIELFELERTILARALEQWPVALRTLDALHLATADYVRRHGETVELASYDARLIAAARALGIAITSL